MSLVPVSPTPLAETDLPIAEVEVDDRFSTCGIGLVGSASTLEPGEAGLGLGSSASTSAAASTSVSSLWVIGRSRRLAFVSALSRTLRARAVARGADRISGRRSAPPVGHGSCALLGMTQRQDDKTSFLRFPHHGLDAYAVALDACACASSSSAIIISWRWPAESVRWSGRPWVSTTAWILVETPPRERPKALLSIPPFRPTHLGEREQQNRRGLSLSLIHISEPTRPY